MKTLRKERGCLPFTSRPIESYKRHKLKQLKLFITHVDLFDHTYVISRCRRAFERVSRRLFNKKPYEDASHAS